MVFGLRSAQLNCDSLAKIQIDSSSVKEYSDDLRSSLDLYSKCWELDSMQRYAIFDRGMLEGFVTGFIYFKAPFPLTDLESIKKNLIWRFDNPGTKKLIREQWFNKTCSELNFNRGNWEGEFKDQVLNSIRSKFYHDSVKNHFESYLAMIPENKYDYLSIIYGFIQDYSKLIEKRVSKLKLKTKNITGSDFLDSINSDEFNENLLFVVTGKESKQDAIDLIINDDIAKPVFIGINKIVIETKNITKLSKTTRAKLSLSDEIINPLIVLFNDDLEVIWKGGFDSYVTFKITSNLHSYRFN